MYRAFKILGMQFEGVNWSAIESTDNDVHQQKADIKNHSRTSPDVQFKEFS